MDKVPFGKRGTHPAESRQTISSYANTFAGLIDKYVTYVLSRRNVPSIVVLMMMGWVFVQDNAAGRLQNWHDLLWTTQKCLFFVALYGVLQIVRIVHQPHGPRHHQTAKPCTMSKPHRLTK